MFDCLVTFHFLCGKEKATIIQAENIGHCKEIVNATILNNPEQPILQTAYENNSYFCVFPENLSHLSIEKIKPSELSSSILFEASSEDLSKTLQNFEVHKLAVAHLAFTTEEKSKIRPLLPKSSQKVIAKIEKKGYGAIKQSDAFKAQQEFYSAISSADR